MAVNQPTAMSARIPPDVPSDPRISPSLTEYLRNFSLWCRNGFAEQMRNNEAVPGLMVKAYDAPAGTTPKVFLIQVNTAGVVSAVQMMIGGANPR